LHFSNDSPALKKADIGVAMGISGSDVSRDAAHVVLMKDDFAAIAVGVKMGRTIFDNITKTIGYTITHMLPEVSAVIMNLVFGYPLGLTAIMILFIDLGTEVAPAVSLAFEKSEADVMDRPPRNAATDRLVTGRLAAYFVFQSGLIETVFAMIGYFSVFAYYGITGGCLAFADAYFTATSGNLLCNGRVYSQAQQLDYLSQAQTLYWVMIVGSQLFHIFACKARVRSLWEHGIFDNQQMVYGTCLCVVFFIRVDCRLLNSCVFSGVLIEFFIMMFVVFVPWTLSFFGSASFPGFFWFLPLAPAALLMIRQELVKWYSLQNPDSWIAKNVNW
jgi:sodium/potassium-transporting ATPase subunit alpha